MVISHLSYGTHTYWLYIIMRLTHVTIHIVLLLVPRVFNTRTRHIKVPLHAYIVQLTVKLRREFIKTM